MIVSTLSLRRVYIASLKLFAVLQRVRRYTDVHDCDVACNESTIIIINYSLCVGEDWKRGRWSVQEMDKLKHNIRLFIKVSHCKQHE